MNEPNEPSEKLQIIRERLTKIEAYERKIWLFLTNIIFILAIATKNGIKSLYLGIAIVFFVLLMSKISQDIKRKKIQVLGEHLFYLPPHWQDDLHLLIQEHAPTRFLLLVAFGAVYFISHLLAYVTALFLYGLSFYAEAVYKNRNNKIINSLNLTQKRPFRRNDYENNHKMKRIIYIILTTLLGIILSFILHAGIETLYLKYAKEISWHHGCALPYWLQVSLILTGVIGGFLLGRFWWPRYKYHL